MVSCVVDRETGLVDVEMGSATFEPTEISTIESVWGRELPDARWDLFNRVYDGDWQILIVWFLLTTSIVFQRSRGVE